MTIKEFLETPEKLYIHVSTQKIYDYVLDQLTQYINTNYGKDEKVVLPNGIVLQNRYSTFDKKIPYGYGTVISNISTYADIDYVKSSGFKLLKINWIKPETNIKVNP